MAVTVDWLSDILANYNISFNDILLMYEKINARQLSLDAITPL